MATFQASTPPPSTSRIRTPTTPQFGTFEDDYQPYRPRRSTRVSHKVRPAQAHTPPPQTPGGRNLRTIHHPSPQSPRTSSSSLPGSSSSSRSPQTAPKKRAPKSSPEIGGRRVSGALNYNSTVSAAAALGLQTPRKLEKMAPQGSSLIARANGMLPTPAKTPTTRPEAVISSPAIRSIARNLFPTRSATVEEAMPSPKKKGKRYTGFTLDSFEAEEEQIPIFTDSNDRVPEVDVSDNNPFYGDGAEDEEPTKRASKRIKVYVPGEGDKDIEELEHRNDGALYVFRGRKVFKKFDEIDNAGDSGSMGQGSTGGVDLEGEVTAASNATRQSPLKPRLLFPSAKQTIAKETRRRAAEEEEADTDIEEVKASSPITRSREQSTSADVGSTPKSKTTHMIDTPMAPKFGLSPPTTQRTTRSKDVGAGLTSDDEPPPTPGPQIRKRRGSPVTQHRKKLRY